MTKIDGFPRNNNPSIYTEYLKALFTKRRGPDSDILHTAHTDKKSLVTVEPAITKLVQNSEIVLYKPVVCEILRPAQRQTTMP